MHQFSRLPQSCFHIHNKCVCVCVRVRVYVCVCVCVCVCRGRGPKHILYAQIYMYACIEELITVKSASLTYNLPVCTYAKMFYANYRYH